MSTSYVVSGAALLVIVASSAVAQTPTVPVLTYDEYLNNLTVKKVREITQRAAREGVLVPSLDYCAHLDEIDLLRWYITTAPEPLGSLCVDKLSGLLADLAGNDRLFAASILYRYDRLEGRTQLAQMLAADNADAAFILGLNHEVEFIDGILRVFREEQSSREREFIRALGTWQHPQAVEILLEAFKADRNNIDYGIALSVSGAAQAAPIIEKYFDAAESDDVGKLDAAAALVRLGVDTDQYLSYLVQQTQAMPPPFEAWPTYALGALGMTGAAQAESTLILRINTFLSAATPTPGTGAVGGGQEREEAVAAAKALRGFSSEEAATAVAALLQRLATGSNQIGPSVLEQELAVVLLMIGNQGGIGIARQQLGNAWVDRAVSVRNLKVIPPRFLPSSSNTLLLELKG